MREQFEIDFDNAGRPAYWNDPDVIYTVGISGGKDSTAVLLWMIHQSGIPKHQIEATFCDTGNEHEWTYAHIDKIDREIHPVTRLYPEKGFYDLAFHKHRFPSTKARFCTQFLKIIPTLEHVHGLVKSGRKVISVSGVRWDESDDRAKLIQWDYSGNLLCYQWRPIISWTLLDVLGIHGRYNFPMNPLYALGAARVGCWPCIMSAKEEIRIIVLQFPHRIDEIREAEQRFEKQYGRYSSFFPANTVPPRFRTKPFYSEKKKKWMMVASIDDVARWALSGWRGKGTYLDNPGPVGGRKKRGHAKLKEIPKKERVITCSSGFCE